MVWRDLVVVMDCPIVLYLLRRVQVTGVISISIFCYKPILL